MLCLVSFWHPRLLWCLKFTTHITLGSCCHKMLCLVSLWHPKLLVVWQGDTRHITLGSCCHRVLCLVSLWNPKLLVVCQSDTEHITLGSSNHRTLCLLSIWHPNRRGKVLLDVCFRGYSELGTFQKDKLICQTRPRKFLEKLNHDKQGLVNF